MSGSVLETLAARNKDFGFRLMTHSTNGHDAPARRTFDVRILRQDAPEQPSYWERHTLELEPDMNITSVLQRIAAQAQTAEGEAVAPVAYDATAWKKSAVPARC